MNEIFFIATGGTFDRATRETGVSPKDSILKKYLEKEIKPHFKFSVAVPFLKDSRDITDADLKKLSKIINESSAHKIVIIHGTCTMAETGLYLKEHLLPSQKTIVLTGAFKYFNQDYPDGFFNLGFACANALSLSPGIYLCINGKTWLPGELYKDIVNNRFEDSPKISNED